MYVCLPRIYYKNSSGKSAFENLREDEIFISP